MNIKRLITFLVFISLISNVKSEVKTDSTKIYFDNALLEVKEMLEGSRPLDFQRAVFITENAYHENNYSYTSFQRAIKNHLFFINQLIKVNNKSDSLDFNVKVNKNGRFNIDEIRYTPEQKEGLYNNVVANWSIFTYLTDTTAFGSIVHFPYQYNAKDPFGMNDWTNSQVINLLAANNSVGNCFALTALYKIFSNQLNSDAVICTAPQHIYIQHKDHKGDWYNVELATAGHPADGSIQTLTYTTNKALMSNIALRTLDEKQSVALCLVNLAKSYEHKYNNKTDDFLLQCAELALKHDPKNLNALLLKQQVLDAKVVEYASKNKIDNIEKLKKDKNINSQLQQLENHLAYLSELGYIQMPVDMQEVVLNGFKGENAAQFIKKDKNPSPFTTIDVPEEDNQYLDLSSGIFQEVFEPKEIEVYGHFTFNTKSNELTKIDTQTVNNQIIDPVAFAYDLGARMYDARLGRFISIDPLAHEFPYWSPYSAFANNPIFYTDPDGKKVKAVNVNAKVGLYEAIFSVFNTGDEIDNPAYFFGMDQFGNVEFTTGIRDKKGRFTKEFKAALANLESDEVRELAVKFVEAIESETVNLIEVVTNEDSKETGTRKVINEFEFNTSDKETLPENGSSTFVEKTGKNATLTISATKTITNPNRVPGQTRNPDEMTSTSIGDNKSEALEVIKAIVTGNKAKNPEPK